MYLFPVDLRPEDDGTKLIEQQYLNKVSIYQLRAASEHSIICHPNIKYKCMSTLCIIKLVLLVCSLKFFFTQLFLCLSILGLLSVFIIKPSLPEHYFYHFIVQNIFSYRY